MTNHYTDVCEETIESLRQQLADRDEQISDLTISSDTYFAERNSARDVWRRASKDRDELRQQLADSQKEIALLRWYLGEIAELSNCQWSCDKATKALAATDDLSGYILCEKEPVGSDFSGALYRAWEPKP